MLKAIFHFYLNYWQVKENRKYPYAYYQGEEFENLLYLKDFFLCFLADQPWVRQLLFIEY